MSSVNALEQFLTSTQIVIIRGDPQSAGHWATSLQALYAPSRMTFAIPNDAVDLPPALATKGASAGPTAYVCTGMTCSAPVTDLAALVRIATAMPRGEAS
jgi:uncharacterized protein YyaL (SSP411 family)